MSYKLEDFVDIETNDFNDDANSIIAMCKRHNNAKREFLFVDKIQAKHIPTRFSDFRKLTDTLYDKINTAFSPKGRILIIGFAETATALSARIMEKFCYSKAHENDDIWYIQTTRRTVKNAKPIEFLEEHSHATEQKLYWNPATSDINTIIIIDDEITTGNTVINMVRLLKQFYPEAQYHCASILNWQNSDNRKRFADNNITATAVITGKLKASVPVMNDIIEKDYNNTCAVHDSNRFTQSCMDKAYLKSDGTESFLTGCDRNKFKRYLECMKTVFAKNTSYNKDKKYLIVGTEECMYPAIILSSMIENSVCQSTTRSPISVSDTDGYLINDETSLCSNYGTYQVHLYGIPENKYDEIILVTDMPTKMMYTQLCNLAKMKGIPENTMLGV